MRLNQLINKNIAFLGLGLENQALLEYLNKKKIKAQITICDARPNIKNIAKISKTLKTSWKLGPGFNQNLENFDLLFRSPGWPINCPGIQKAIKASSNKAALKPCLLYSPLKLFFNLCPTKNIIGVTGTKGKGTTASLIYAILKSSGKRVWLGGNIGVAPFSFISKIKKNDWVVLELSSFQLEDFHVSPHIAVITNLTSEHLAPADPLNPNYHPTLKHYYDSKFNIFRYQKKDDFLIINTNLKKRIKKLNPRAKVLLFSRSNLTSRLAGEHNKENIAAAEIAATLAQVGKSRIKEAVAGFQALPHRLEFVKKINEVSYYNDTFATTPESAITAIDSFDGPIILLAGGAEKNSDFRNFAKKIKAKVRLVILLAGVATPRIKNELLKIGFSAIKIKNANSIAEAVKLARENGQTGDIVLLSPACASFGMFKNYKERGDLFKEEISKLANRPV